MVLEEDKDDQNFDKSSIELDKNEEAKLICGKKSYIIDNVDISEEKAKEYSNTLKNSTSLKVIILSNY